MLRYGHATRAFHLAIVEKIYYDYRTRNPRPPVRNNREQRSNRMAMPRTSFDLLTLPMCLTVEEAFKLPLAWDGRAFQQEYLKPRYLSLIKEEAPRGIVSAGACLIQARFPLGVEHYVVLTTRLGPRIPPGTGFAAGYSMVYYGQQRQPS